jgi:signal transduction histidine kinase
MQEGVLVSEPDRARRVLNGGVLAFRLAAFVWMVVSNALASQPLRHPVVAWVALGVTGVWVVFITLLGRELQPWILWGDLAVSAGLIVISGFVMHSPGVANGRLFFATTYPASTALAWGAARGWKAGLFAAFVLGIALVLERQANGVSLAGLTGDQVVGLGNGIVYPLLAGGAAGVVAHTLDRSSVQLRFAVEDAIHAREHAARLAHHKAMARAIHDSVLQALAFINKRGHEIASAEPVSSSEVLRLADLAAAHEQQLRTLILREPSEAPGGATSLREALEGAARQIPRVAVTVNAIGPIWLPTSDLDQLMGAVRQALDNVVEHAGASHAAIFSEIDDGWVTVSVRDNGRGFVYTEEQLRAEHKEGMLGSMKGRIEDLGGRMRVHTAPGAGTEVEFRVPLRTAQEGPK